MSELAVALSRSRTVADHLAAQIEPLAVGHRLGTKKELSARLGVAPATMTEAVRLLQERGLITVRPGPKGGVFVARPDPFARLGRTLLAVRDRPELVTGAIEVRESLEALTALDALRHRTDADIAALRDRLAEVEAALDDDDEFLRAIWRLHERIADCGANLVLRSVYSSVLAYLDAATEQVVPGTKPPAYKQLRLDVHRRLVAAIIDQDEPACRAAITAHDFDHRRPIPPSPDPENRG